MKIVLPAILIFLSVAEVFCQDGISAAEYQQNMNEDFKNPEESPLTSEDLKKFKALDFFSIDSAYIVKAEFVRTPAEAPFAMQTSTDRLPIYVKYGELYFTLKGEKFSLNLYQNQELVKDPEYFDYLFLPFNDLTNGESTYANGRYLDMRIPESNTVVIDFNKAYNPYCAYNGRYSCPIPPEENNLEIAIPAGVKNYAK